MRFVKAGVDGFLVVARRGRMANRGLGGAAFVWGARSAVVVPAGQQEACFEMTQESQDGIPLRFKGIVLFRVVDPIAAATRFDFTRDIGLERIRTLLAHVCLGELRATVSAMTMRQCIEERKTTLSDAVARSLRAVTAGATPDELGAWRRSSLGALALGAPGDGTTGDGSWGLALDLVQVAQVFIVDDELRRKLEAELRNEIASRGALSDIRTREEIDTARAASQRRLQDRSIEDDRSLVRQRTELRREALELRGLEVEFALLEERARQELRLQALPLEQVPAIAEALARMLQGAQLTSYGGELPGMAAIAPIVDLLASRLRHSTPSVV